MEACENVLSPPDTRVDLRFLSLADGSESEPTTTIDDFRRDRVDPDHGPSLVRHGRRLYFTGVRVLEGW